LSRGPCSSIEISALMNKRIVRYENLVCVAFEPSESTGVHGGSTRAPLANVAVCSRYTVTNQTDMYVVATWTGAGILVIESQFNLCERCEVVAIYRICPIGGGSGALFRTSSRAALSWDGSKIKRRCRRLIITVPEAFIRARPRCPIPPDVWFEPWRKRMNDSALGRRPAAVNVQGGRYHNLPSAGPLINLPCLNPSTRGGRSRDAPCSTGAAFRRSG
jgi:hypothetical protein